MPRTRKALGKSASNPRPQRRPRSKSVTRVHKPTDKDFKAPNANRSRGLPGWMKELARCPRPRPREVGVSQANPADPLTSMMPHTRAQLLEWLNNTLGLSIPTTALASGSHAPFDYLVHSFFEGAGSWHGILTKPSTASPDCIVWANRGGGKTFLGAVATLLDLLFKPRIRVRILGGSLEQSSRMMHHLRSLLAKPVFAGLLLSATERRVELINHSSAEVAAASQTSVRGSRVHKIRCDEVDLFTRELWDAAQLTVTSNRLGNPWSGLVKGSVEALSTMQNPFGLMWDLVGDASSEGAPSASSGSSAITSLQPEGLIFNSRGQSEIAAGDRATPPVSGAHQFDPERVVVAHRPRRIFRWGVVDVLRRCTDEHQCVSCPLFDDCGGRAKQRDAAGQSPGHVRIADAIAMKMRVGVATWESEMLCLRPRREDAVFPEFDASVHVYGEGAEHQAAGTGEEGRRFVCGMDFGLRSDAVVLLATVSADNVLRIVDEHVASEKTLDEHIEAIAAWRTAGRNIAWVGVDPAGRGREGQSGVSNVTLLRRAGFVVRYRALPREQGIAMVRARLAPAWAGQAGPRLLIHARCRSLIESLSRHHYSENRASVEPVKDGTDHACDALRYLVVNLDGRGEEGNRHY